MTRLFFLTIDALGFIQRLTMKPTVQLRHDVRPRELSRGRAHWGALGCVRGWSFGGASVTSHRSESLPASPISGTKSCSDRGMQFGNLSDFGDFGYLVAEVTPF